MKTSIQKISIFVVALLVCIACVFSLMACDKKDEPKNLVNYKAINDYEVQTTKLVVNPEEKESLQCGADIYYPKDATAKYGLIFFVGTAIKSEYYAYLGNALAKQGYIAAIIFGRANMAYTFYLSDAKPAAEKLREQHPDIKFFVGGHSQGGGAALRFADEEEESVLGAVFLAPLCNTHKIEREDYNKYEDPLSTRFEKDEDGNDIVIIDTLADSTLPVLLIEAHNDRVLTEDMKRTTLNRMPQEYMFFDITPGAHMSFSTYDNDTILSGFLNDGDGITEEEKVRQRTLTVSYILDFLQITVAEL